MMLGNSSSLILLKVSFKLRKKKKKRVKKELERMLEAVGLCL